MDEETLAELGYGDPEALEALMESGVMNPTEPGDPRYGADGDPGPEAYAVQPADPEEESEQDRSERAEEIQALVERSMEVALSHFQEELEPDMVEATDYFFGKPQGDERAGRSKVVMTTLRDVVLNKIPSIMDVVFGPERIVEFVPNRVDQREQAEQQTDLVRHVVEDQNRGYFEFLSALQDGLVRRLGWFKWWWESEQVRPFVVEYENLTFQDLSVLAATPGVEVEPTAKYLPEEMQAPGMMQQGEVGPEAFLYSATISRVETKGRARFMAVPPEEVVFAPYTRQDLQTSPLVAHTRMVPADELIAMGIDPDLVDEMKGRPRQVNRGEEDLEEARRLDSQRVGENPRLSEERDASQEEVLFSEVWMLVDADGDGIGERRRFDCVGPSYQIVNGDGLGEVVHEVPLSCWTPYPEPHTLIGQSDADLTMDLQRIQTQITRLTLDSLAQSIVNTQEVVESMVNMKDLIDPQPSGVIRVKAPGQIRELKHQFVGPDTLPMMDRFEEIVEARTGSTRAQEGLSPETMQSTTREAIQNTLSKGQERKRQITRVFLEMAVIPLMKGLRDLLIRHQDRAMVTRLRGSFVEIDPRFWDADLDCRINAGIGQGTPQERVQALMALAQAQEAHIQAGSPLTSRVHLRRTLGRMVEAAGFPNPDEFWVPWGEQEEQQYLQQQAQAAQEAQAKQPPDPTQLMFQLEASKLKNAADEAREKLALEKRKMTLEDDRERDRTAREFALKQSELEARYAAKAVDAAPYRENTGEGSL